MPAISIPDINEELLRNLQIKADQTAHVIDLPGYPAEVRAVMAGEEIDYFEIYDTSTGECLNLGDPIYEWPHSDEGKKSIHEMLASHFENVVVKAKPARKTPSSGPGM